MTFPFPTYAYGSGGPEIVATASSASTSGERPHTANLPDYSAGDTVFLAVTVDAGAGRTLAAPSGWTTEYLDTTNNDNMRSVGLFSKVMTGSEGSTVSVDASGGNSRYTTAAVTIKPFDSADVGTLAKTSGLGTSLASPSLATPAQLWIAVAHNVVNIVFPATGNSAEFALNNPTGYTTSVEGDVVYSSDSRRCRTRITYKAEPASSESPGNWTFDDAAVAANLLGVS
jgi:hypothetical protein